MRRRLLVACALAAMLAAGAAADAGAATPAGLPTCALGRLPAALRTFLPDAIARRHRSARQRVGPGRGGAQPRHPLLGQPARPVGRADRDRRPGHGRPLIDGQADLPAARQVLSGYALTPLSAWAAGARSAPLILDAFPGNQTTPPVPTGAAFYDTLGQDLAATPPPASDDCALQAFAAAGIGPGRTPSGTADPLTAHALAAAAAAGPRLVDAASTAMRRDSQHRHNGWFLLAGDTGRFGADYANRAVTANIGLAANTTDQALYPNTDTDSRGRVLDGRHAYVVAFQPGQLPPVHAFWSLTLYGADRYFAPNALQRFALGDRTPGLRYGPGRSLRLFVSHRPPPAAERSNWLPAPRGRFLLYLRLYEPKPAAAAGHWLPPSVLRTG